MSTSGGFCGSFNVAMAIVLWPFRLLYLIVYWLIYQVGWILYIAILTIWSFRNLIFFGAVIWGVSYVFYNEYGVVITQAEYLQRCYLYPLWIKWYQPLLLSVRDIYDNAICWTNAVGFINRILSTDLLIQIFENCEGRFDLFVWLRLLGTVVTNLIIVVFSWSFAVNPFENSVPIYGTLLITAQQLVPMTAQGSSTTSPRYHVSVTKY